MKRVNMSGDPYLEGRVDAIGIEHLDGLFSYAMTVTRNRTEAEDLVQETYVRAMNAIANLRPDSNLKAWLFTILRNVWLNQLRKRHGGPQMVEIEGAEGIANSIVEPSKDSLELYISKVEAEQVQAAIQELPTESREVILLREYEDLSYLEIASVLDCPVGTVMSRLARARAKLRESLSAELGESDPGKERGAK
jgi:RNA polymerase sigma-70 factor, ECF subfamily